jgi:hypothetical protein
VTHEKASATKRSANGTANAPKGSENVVGDSATFTSAPAVVFLTSDLASALSRDDYCRPLADCRSTRLLDKRRRIEERRT